MATQAKLEGNARYLAKMKSISLRMPPEMHEEIRKAAQASTNGSVQGYILQAVRTQLNADIDQKQLVTISMDEAKLYAEVSNQNVETWIADRQCNKKE